MSIDPPEKNAGAAAEDADLGASALSQDDSVWASPSVGSVEDVYRQLLARAPESAMEPRMEAVEQAVELLGDPHDDAGVRDLLVLQADVGAGHQRDGDRTQAEAA